MKEVAVEKLNYYEKTSVLQKTAPGAFPAALSGKLFAADKQKQLPNIAFIMADDLGYDD